MLRALDDLGIDAGRHVYVGDTTVDLEMASAAGVPFVAVGTTTPPAASARPASTGLARASAPGSTTCWAGRAPPF